MDIDLNDALHHLADDDRQPDAARDDAAGEATTELPEAAPAEQAATEEPAATEPVAEPAATEPVAAAPAATTATTTGGATAAPAPAPAPVEPAAGAPVADEIADPEPTGGHKALWYAGAAAALVACGVAALWPGGHHDAISAAPASTSAAASTAASPAASAAPSTSSTPSAASRPSSSAWAWTGADPAGTSIDLDQARSRCQAKANEQLVGPKGTTTLRPGMSVRIGPKSAAVPANNAVPTGWRTCTLGYQTQPAAAAVGQTELSRVPANLVQACSKHSGFDMAGWKVAVVDTRLNPRTNNVSDATVAMTGPNGWALGCEISAGADAATLTFLAPTDNSCPSVHAAPMGAPGGVGGKPAAGGPAGEGPGGSLYWVTAFGRVPAKARAAAVSGGYDIGKVSESAAMVRVGNGLAVANHTWKPDQADPSDTSKTPTVTFFDKGGKALASCAAS